MHVFFDLDGTLTDPKEATYKAKIAPTCMDALMPRTQDA